MGFQDMTKYTSVSNGAPVLLHVIVCLLIWGTWPVMAADRELVLHQNEQSIIENALGVHVAHSGYYPSKYLRISPNPLRDDSSSLRIPPNPLRDQPNLSVDKVRKRTKGAIHGSRKAYVVTTSDYLKKEWCKTELVKQTIRKDGCLNKTIINRFCYGQCNSFFIPRRRGRNIAKNAFESCAFCRPKTTDFVRVTLNCPGRNIKRLRKKVQIIKSCNCAALNLD